MEHLQASTALLQDHNPASMHLPVLMVATRQLLQAHLRLPVSATFLVKCHR